VLALDPRAIGKDPRRKAFDAGLGANRLDSLRALDPTLNVWGVLKRRAELFFLLFAMRTPKGAVHFGLLCRQAFRKSVQTAGVFVPKEVICGRECNDDHDGNHDVTRTVWIRLLSAFPLLLPFSAFL